MENATNWANKRCNKELLFHDISEVLVNGAKVTSPEQLQNAPNGCVDLMMISLTKARIEDININGNMIIDAAVDIISINGFSILEP